MNIFIIIVIAIAIISFLLALRSLRTVNEKPRIGDVKKSLDKDRIIFRR